MVGEGLLPRLPASERKELLATFATVASPEAVPFMAVALGLPSPPPPPSPQGAA